MKTLIVGLGNIAIMHGWAFAEAGVDVTHVVRKGKLDQYNHPIKMDVLDLREGHPPKQVTTYTPKVIDEVDPADGYELVMLPTKEYQLADAVKQYKEVLPNALYLMFSANWKGPDAIDALLPRSQYLWGYATVNGGPLDGKVYANIRSDYRIGMMEGNDPAKLDAVTALFAKADFKADFKENMMHWLWVHHATNGAVIGTALYAGGIAEWCGNPAMMIYMIHCAREAIEVLKARGVDVSKEPDVAPYLKEPINAYAEKYADSIMNTEYGQRVVNAGHFSSSIYEMSCFYMDTLLTGEELGLPMPHMQAMRARIEKLREAVGIQNI